MIAANTSSSNPAWLYWALLTVACWGIYGIFLHTGAQGMADPVNGRIKAFLWVGLAYFLTAVLAPLILLKMKGVSIAFWEYPAPGVWWSLIAGILGAIGALGVLLAFGAAPKPTPLYVPVIMSIIFAGAPIVNAVIATTKEHNWPHVKAPFILGIALAALGGFLVTKYKPTPPAKPAAQAAPTQSSPAN
ncbi:MAG: hypothetical protein EXS22_05140 [Pedosphaera sp.]|nr:hypothetical protein [Pedosphaera sp.]